MKQTKAQVAWTNISQPEQEPLLLVPYALLVGQEDRCHHHEPLKGVVGLSVCNNWTEGSCACCGKPTCEKHFSARTITLEHGRVFGEYVLCLECCRLSREQVEAIFALRLALNKP